MSRKTELSRWMDENFPANYSSISRRKPLYGVGINDARYCITTIVDGKTVMDPCYRAWSNMLSRCYDESYSNLHTTYLCVTVCQEWLKFSSFREWWLDNHVDEYQLDKDLIHIGNKVYSPSRCAFIPQWLNKFTTDRGVLRGKFPIGVYWNKQQQVYMARCNNPYSGKNDYLGRFECHNLAHEAWKKRKLSLATELKPEMDAIDNRIYNNVISIIKSLSPS